MGSGVLAESYRPRPSAHRPLDVGDDGPMARRRGFESARDMVLSLGVVLAVVAVVFLITLRETPEAVTVVDATPVVELVGLNAPFAAVTPEPIEGWRITSARVSQPGEDAFRWHLGYYTPDGRYAAAGQSDGSQRSYLEDERAGGAEAGTVRIDGRTWTVLERADGERRSLVLSSDGVTTLITGTGDVNELTVLAKALKPVAGTPATPPPTSG